VNGSIDTSKPESIHFEVKMTNIYDLFAVLAGVALRLVIPLLITGLAVFFLRRLDKRWQSEGIDRPLLVKKPECWKINKCSPALRKNCPGYLSPLPCWQAMRLPNRTLRNECLDCKIFRSAPIPLHSL
jgi:hypothetical protein